MEWVYVPFKDLMSNYDTYTWDTGLEPILNEVASRGNQVAMRVYLEYPGCECPIPDFILNSGIAMRSGADTVPDYDDPRMIDILTKLIAAFGKRYDGDPRIGIITLGLIGFW